MGGLLSGLWRFAFGNPQRRFKITIIGLDNAGKTTALYKLLDGVVINTQPTVGSNVETIERKNVRLQCWDLAGQTAFRKGWTTFFNGTDAIIFVVDSSDRVRMTEARNELFRVLEDDSTSKCSILILANKQDLPNCLTLSELMETLQLSEIKNQHWTILPACSLTGQGLEEAVDWLVMQLDNAAGK
ncbi:small GTP-binding protein, putative [Trichomonas vaginalis G3]|uniref:Small GTP-binding protein, putative n=1 Tax=Trichomonas vaginalis (strain ATCC PRA-98 / G3) TaxID=412133 RepID=A2G2C2_TRIV3|nr:GTP binding [Trichomonas vaginalis G3]EAX88701.1 small GTP-binding protein, putative [Trichomonas vaginalis G3]KAI5519893.1 GTP binding [Trichomonas vaginalis G3]|eukprot:XP_001301631.1 small GTP-binding protein [Trichomonas vaginalis G3]